MTRFSSIITPLLASCKSLRTLKQIHAQIILNRSDQNPGIISRFLVLCNSFSSLGYAVSVFNRVAKPSLYLYNALLKAHCDHATPLQQPLSLLSQLLNSSSSFGPDGYTFTSLLKSCANEGNVLIGSSLHCFVIRAGLDSDAFVRTELVYFYGKCGLVKDARKVFDEMRGGANVVSWTAMITGYLGFGDVRSARMLFDEMPDRSEVSWNVMIDGYAKAGDMASARELFEEMRQKSSVALTSVINGYAKVGDMASARFVFERGKKELVDVFSWSAMISGYAQNGQPAEAVKIFLEMYEKKKVQPDEHVVVGLMSACSQMGSLSLAKFVESYIEESRIDVKRTHVIAALVNLNVKCGNMNKAGLLFESMSNRDLFSYCSMVQGYSLHGDGCKAVGLFSRMLKEGVLPDAVAFTVILNACSHAGLLEEGKHYFEMMKNKYSIIPTQDHYACMVDLLARAGHLKEASELIESMPLEPHAGVLGALLGACRLHCNVELGELIANKLFEIEPQNPGNYVLLSNIYAANDRWGDVSQLRTVMREKGLRKIPGVTKI